MSILEASGDPETTPSRPPDNEANDLLDPSASSLAADAKLKTEADATAARADNAKAAVLAIEEAHEKDEAQACLLVRAMAHPSHRSHCSYGVARAGVRVSKRRRRRRALKKRTRKTKPRPACWFVPLRILLIVLIVLIIFCLFYFCLFLPLLECLSGDADGPRLRPHPSQKNRAEVHRECL